MRLIAASALLFFLAIGCNKDKPKDGGEGSGAGSAALPGAEQGSGGSAAAGSAAPAQDDLDSKDVMARTKVAREAHVRQVLLSWRDREAFYAAIGGELDARAKARDRAAAGKLATELLAQLRAKPDSIGELIEQHSEDPTSRAGDPLRVEPGGAHPAGLIQLALRLEEQEAGVVTTDYGYHVVLRVGKPVPDPLESDDILKRDVETPPIYRQQIVIGWDQRPANTDPRARGRTKEAADALAKELLAKVRGKGDMAKLMKQHSEDPKTKDSARIEKVPEDAAAPADRLASRLKIDEAGLVRGPLGWYVVKRVAAPPVVPDKLESLAILKRKRLTAEAKVKHILVGWDEVNAGDDRAKRRSRAQLEQLVPEILARAQKGEAFESLMLAHSEDAPEAVKSGEAYEVAPDAGFVLPFIELSLRLKVGELGVVKTEFGLHIIKRIE